MADFVPNSTFVAPKKPLPVISTVCWVVVSPLLGEILVTAGTAAV